jgi:uncharacterized membrane protein
LNKESFLCKLEGLLQNFSQEERKDILYDYEEHFRIGIEEGKTEEAIAKHLGEPSDIVKQYIKIEGNRTNLYETSSIFDSNVYRKSSVLRLVMVATGLLFLNIILLGPYIGIASVVFSFFIVSFALFLSSIAFLLAPIVPQLVSIPINMPYLSMIFFAICLAALGALVFIGSYYAGKYVYKVTINYCKFNIRIIKEKRGEDYV